MYTGSNKTALTSQKQIADALTQLLRTNSYTSISISAICKEAGVSRQTFYSLFESKENIIIYELSKKHSFQPEETCCCKSMSLSDLCHAYSCYITDKKELLSLLVKNDIVYLMHECLYDSLYSCTCFQPQAEGQRRAFLAEFFAGGLSGIVKIYITQGAEMSQKELEDTIYGLFSGDYFKEL